MRRIVYLALLLLLPTLLFVGTSTAQEGGEGQPTDNDVNRVAKQLYCPVCENIPLDVCPTTACEQWRGIIRQKLAAGETDKEIIDYFVAQYGPRVRATPPAAGFSWLVYLVPPVAILAGAYLLYRAFRAWKTPSSQAVPGVTTNGPRDEYVNRLEEELRKR